MTGSSDSFDNRFEQACRLADLGQFEEAQAAYMALLAEAPAHGGVLNNLGNLVYSQGFTSAARTLYMQAITHHPRNPTGYVNLGNVLAACDERENAMQQFETALQLDPEQREAHRGLAYLLTESREEERAAFHRNKAFEGHAILTLPFYGEGAPVALLVLASASGGAIPMSHHFDRLVFQVTMLFVEFFASPMTLPPHQLVFNGIGDADLCKPALEKALPILERISAPVINHPLCVMPTGRMENARRLGQLPDVITAKTVMLPRAVLERADAAATLSEHGFSFPLLLRSPGFHTGRFFVRVENAAGLEAGLADTRGNELLVMQYLDARSPDGKIRKYRVMMIDGVLYPLHAAISKEWKIHYFTADMADNPENRAEDEAFLYNMEQVLGARAMRALHAVAEALGLDYGGIDFSVDAEGNIMLFEANATMVVYSPGKDARWEYRKAAVERILLAIKKLLTRHA